MTKEARLRKMVKQQSTYDCIINAYKTLIRENNKRKLYRFKALLYACLNPSERGGWRKVDDFFSEENMHLILTYFTSVNNTHWFGIETRNCIKKTI